MVALLLALACSPKSPPVAVVPASEVVARPAVAGPAASVARDGETYVVRRDALRAWFDPATSTPIARALPHRGPDGAVDGLRLGGVTEAAPVYHLGLRNGDVVHRLGAFPLTGVTAAVDAWLGLQTESSAVLLLTRDGQPMSIAYRAVDALPGSP